MNRLLDSYAPSLFITMAMATLAAWAFMSGGEPIETSARLNAGGQDYETSQMANEASAELIVGTSATQVTCGTNTAIQTWKCVDSAAGGVTVFRGGSDVTTLIGFPEAADAAFGGNSRSAYLVAAAPVTLRCVCGK